ncbi:hypothetical protein FHS07_000098 [Microbacterium proteolyticum]|uniref:Uncharacterized protein n=1 Tax=Microbacterium proteolyticum TaxID=1572644 RepID=A0A7W5GDG3_9MICO|nr:hypothetical protein [Microbacterium proteolyticum]MBB3156414.1 hypothetical protein [Microbacterium proteolyticum]
MAPPIAFSAARTALRLPMIEKRHPPEETHRHGVSARRSRFSPDRPARNGIHWKKRIVEAFPPADRVSRDPTLQIALLAAGPDRVLAGRLKRPRATKNPGCRGIRGSKTGR